LKQVEATGEHDDRSRACALHFAGRTRRQRRQDTYLERGLPQCKHARQVRQQRLVAKPAERFALTVGRMR